MTTNTAPATPADTAAAFRAERMADQRNTVDALVDAAAHTMGVSLPFPTPAARRAIATIHEIDQRGDTFGQVAEQRQKVRAMLATRASGRRHGWGDYALEDDECQRYALAAMAALGTPDPGAYPTHDYTGARRTIGPYVSDAVAHVLAGVHATESDRNLIVAYAGMFNVVTRGV